MAHPSKLSDQIREKLKEAILAGNYRQKAAQFANISNRTLSYWIAKGQQDPNTPEGQLYLDILNWESQAELRMVTTIQTAARKDWKAAAWWLERKFPKRWGRGRLAIPGGEQPGQIAPLSVNLVVKGSNGLEVMSPKGPEDEVDPLPN